MPDEPLITQLFTADPSAHVFNGRLYLYPSHDRETDITDNDLGDRYDMVDYHVFSMGEVDGPVTDHGVVLALEDPVGREAIVGSGCSGKKRPLLPVLSRP